MAKKTLKVDYDYDFVFIGIVAAAKDYRLCWAMNNSLGIELGKTDELELPVKGSKEPSWFSRYSYAVPGNETVFLLLGNKGTAGYLIPEQKQVDYFLMIQQLQDQRDKDLILKKLLKTDLVQTAFFLDPSKLRSKENLLF